MGRHSQCLPPLIRRYHDNMGHLDHRWPSDSQPSISHRRQLGYVDGDRRRYYGPPCGDSHVVGYLVGHGYRCSGRRGDSWRCHNLLGDVDGFCGRCGDRRGNPCCRNYFLGYLDSYSFGSSDPAQRCYLVLVGYVDSSGDRTTDPAQCHGGLQLGGVDSDGCWCCRSSCSSHAVVGYLDSHCPCSADPT